MNLNNVYIEDNVKKGFDEAVLKTSNDCKNHFGTVNKPLINKRLIFSCKEEDLDYLLKLEELIYNTEPVLGLPGYMGIFRTLRSNWNLSDIEKSKYGYQIVCEELELLTGKALNGNLSSHFQMLLDSCGFEDKIRCDSYCISHGIYIATDEDMKVSYKYALTYLEEDKLFKFKFYDSLKEAKKAANKYTNKLVKLNSSIDYYVGDNDVKLLTVIRSK